MRYYVDDKTAIRDRDDDNRMAIRLIAINCSKSKGAELTELLCGAMNAREKEKS